MTTDSVAGSVMKSVTTLKSCAASCAVTSQAIPVLSSEVTVYVMSRGCSAVKPGPVTIGSSVLTSVLSIVGAYTSDSSPSATVYQTLEPGLGAPAASWPGEPIVRLKMCIAGTPLPTLAPTAGSVTDVTGLPAVSGT